MSNSDNRRFPVTVSQLPVARCDVCDRTVAYRPGKVSEALTEHYRRAHPARLGLDQGGGGGQGGPGAGWPFRTR